MTFLLLLEAGSRAHAVRGPAQPWHRSCRRAGGGPRERKTPPGWAPEAPLEHPNPGWLATATIFQAPRAGSELLLSHSRTSQVPTKLSL